MIDPFHLQRFVDAQDPVFAEVRAELKRGSKQGHWMWFVFPQLKGLGHSHMAQKYGIASRGEAEAFLAHPVLGARLVDCTGLVNLVEGRTIDQILGEIDAMKFRSSMTLFAHVAGENSPFAQALEKYFQGRPDRLTLDRIQA